MAGNGTQVLETAKRRKDGKPVRSTSARLYLALASVTALLLLVEWILASTPFVEAMPAQEISSEFLKKQTETWAEMNKLLIELATLVVGAISGFVVNRDKNAPLPSAQRRKVTVSWILCGASLYFGYLSYQQATWMLSIGFFNAHNPRLWLPMQAQFWTFLFSVIVFADFIYGGLRHKKPDSGLMEGGGG
jgi:hypothetical protein